MSNEAADPHTTFTGSQATASLIAWIDRVLMDLRDGRINDAREALQGETWRTGRIEDGIPRPILEQARDTLHDAAEAVSRDQPDVAAAETALLMARSRFLPGG
ncbi:hypothetical protein [Longimicrobium terrae]|uniref:Uncharacterized protein n=1 Tax=Longimicrobium terrae TaxID=1639882 RepID=A0A841GYD5_9BACT|nr:hypothetical protein [Longimicrobium terrae]MBB4636374.1 hypothetical protein [Longimicrobium terrae]MBB6070770.1 hypothetical protein [Longimicrobium terrae]NNC29750.1 hypothetical protein [Longimicrobium terrae]